MAVVERSDTTGEPLKGHRPMWLVHSAPATRRLRFESAWLWWKRNDTTGELGTCPRPGFLGMLPQRPPQAGESLFRNPLPSACAGAMIINDE